MSSLPDATTKAQSVVIMMINKLISQINNNFVINFSSLYKNIINITKYIITNNEYQIAKIK